MARQRIIKIAIVILVLLVILALIPVIRELWRWALGIGLWVRFT